MPQSAGIRFERVPLGGSFRLHVQLTDPDLCERDQMGVFKIGPAALRACLKVGRVCPVRVAEQTSKQVLFAYVSVLAGDSQ